MKQYSLTVRQTTLATAVVVGRLIRPASYFSTWNWIRDYSSISELTRYPVSRIGKDAVYEIADELRRHKAIIGQHLFGREQQLFPDSQSLYLFDLTNFHMERVCAKNELAAFGKSKQNYYAAGLCIIISSAYALQTRQHIAMDVFTANVSPSVKAILDMIIAILSLITFLVILVLTIQEAVYSVSF